MKTVNSKYLYARLLKAGGQIKKEGEPEGPGDPRKTAKINNMKAKAKHILNKLVEEGSVARGDKKKFLAKIDKISSPETSRAVFDALRRQKEFADSGKKSNWVNRKESAQRKREQRTSDKKKQLGGDIIGNVAKTISGNLGDAASSSLANAVSSNLGDATGLDQMKSFSDPEVQEKLTQMFIQRNGKQPTKNDLANLYNEIFGKKTQQVQDSGVSKDAKKAVLQGRMDATPGTNPISNSNTADSNSTGFDFSMQQGGSLARVRPAVINQIKTQLKNNGVSSKGFETLMEKTVGMSAQELTLNSSDIIGEITLSDRRERLDNYQI